MINYKNKLDNRIAKVLLLMDAIIIIIRLI